VSEPLGRMYRIAGGAWPPGMPIGGFGQGSGGMQFSRD
jgi:hypothetical protein